MSAALFTKSQYRTGETWHYRVQIVDGRVLDALIRESDQTVHGPFKGAGFEECSAYIRENGGGYLDWGSSAAIIPHAPVGQMALFHKAYGCPWWDLFDCEDAPRAYPSCGHGQSK